MTEEQKPYEPPQADLSQSNANSALSSEVRNWAMACHLAALGGLVFPIVGSILGPLIVWLVKRESHSFIDEHGKEALNFQITVGIAGLVCFVLIFIFIGILLMFALGIVALVFTIIAAVKASNGEHYRYPVSLRLIN